MVGRLFCHFVADNLYFIFSGDFSLRGTRIGITCCVMSCFSGVA